MNDAALHWNLGHLIPDENSNDEKLIELRDEEHIVWPHSAIITTAYDELPVEPGKRKGFHVRLVVHKKSKENSEQNREVYNLVSFIYLFFIIFIY